MLAENLHMPIPDFDAESIPFVEWRRRSLCKDTTADDVIPLLDKRSRLQLFGCLLLPCGLLNEIQGAKTGPVVLV